MNTKKKTKHPLKLKTLQEYKKLLDLTDGDIIQAFEINTGVIAGWLARGAPVDVLKKLEAFSAV